METRANYALIGAFTLAIALAAFGFVYWISSGAQLGRATYLVVFSGSVSGLSTGSGVLFNGVKVGEVTHLAIAEKDPSKVDVLIEIENSTPVKADTRARLETRGFAGVADLLLVGGTPRSPKLVAEPGEKYPQIQAERSEIQNLLVNVQTLSVRAAELLVKLDKLIDDNGPALTATLKNAETVSKTLADNSQSITSFLHDAADITHSMRPIAGRLDRVLAAGEKTIRAIDPRQLKKITGNIEGASANFNKFTSGGLRQYEQLAVDARKAIDSLDRTLHSIEKDPSQFIFGPKQDVPEYQGQ